MTTVPDAVSKRATAVAAPRARTAASWRTLRYRRDEERVAIATAVADALRRWRADWGLLSANEAHENLRCACLDASEWKRRHDATFASTPWRLAGADGDKAALWWAVVPPGLPGRLATPSTMLLAQLFDAHAGIVSASAHDARPIRGIAQELADLALTDCAHALARVFRFEFDASSDEALNAMQSVPVACFEVWSGALVLSTPWCGGELRILIDDACASRLLGPRPASPAPNARPGRAALTPVLRGLDSEPIGLDVALNPFELELGMLSALRVGDVVRTTHRLDAPLTASTAGGDVLSEAYLGRCGPARAAELLSIARAPEQGTPARSR